jgi:hypothetical protein
MVCFTPKSRRQIGLVRFSGPEVRFAASFRRSIRALGWSDFDPTEA